MRWFDRITEGGAGVTASGSGALRAPLAIGLQGDGWALRAPPSVLRRSGCRLRSAGNTMLNSEWLTVNSVVSASRGNIKVISMSRKSGKAKMYQGRGLVVRPSKSTGYAKGLQRAYAKEKGYLDTAVVAYPLDTTGSVTLLNAVPQGAGVTQRVGKKIVMKGLQCRGVAQNGPTASANDVAFCIVYDKRPNGAIPLITDILAGTTATSMNNDSNAGRFSILKRWDEVMVGNVAAPANYTETCVVGCDWWLDLKSRPTVYKAAGTGAIGDIEEGALYLLTVGGNVAGTTAAALIASFRMRFLDV
jgi:hypothetical protein